MLEERDVKRSLKHVKIILLNIIIKFKSTNLVIIRLEAVPKTQLGRCAAHIAPCWGLLGYIVMSFNAICLK